MDGGSNGKLGTLIAALSGIMVVAVIGNIVLFARGHQSYSVKYELLMKSQFFRLHPSACNAVEFIYHLFFGVPFFLLLLIAILAATVDGSMFFTILGNGLIVLLTIYPIKNMWFYKSKLIVLALVIASQLNTLYLFLNNSDKSTYAIISSIFYPINAIIFSLAVLAHEQEFWEIEQAIQHCED